MQLSDIKPDECLEMSEELHKIFNAGGCNPTCHCCYNKIRPGDLFKLASVSAEQAEKGNNIILSTFKTNMPHEVMLCDKCSVDLMIQKARNRKFQQNNNFRRSGGCSIINGKIVP